MQPKRILIIDDEDHIREIVTVTLEATQPWEVSTARSGADGVDVARREVPDAILLDVMMPAKDGPTTLRELQADPATKSIPVIFLTAKVQGPDRRKFLQLGVRGIITKPFDPLSLGNQIQELLLWNQPPSTK
jgi:CheY-like chemotaxis protein